MKLSLLKQRTLWCFLSALTLYSHWGLGQTLAFPGAEGFGRYATGGRGGEVYIVTNLNDSGPGSFRDAVSRPNRIVVFEVGGVIKISNRVVVSPNITIAGQTAPGDGVVIYGNGVSFTAAHNAIVRYLRIRMGRGGDSGADAVTITDNANVQIYDHVSASWGRDETFSITGNADSITIQNSIIAQGLQTHSCGGLLEPSGPISLYRNLYIDNNTRNPKVKGRNQFVNNIIYNWGYEGAYIMGGSAGNSYVNIINNYFIEGPSSDVQPFTRGTPTFVPYVEGNYHDANQNGALDGELLPISAYPGITTFRDTPYDYPMPNVVLTPQETYDYVLQNAGASYPFRDPVDAMLIDELASLGLKGALISDEKTLPTQGPGDVHGAPATPDNDRDGIPNAWELANGLNPNDPADSRIINTDGYMNLERYINELINTPAPDFLRPPSGITVTAVSPTQLDINWRDNSINESEFIIERSSDGTTYVTVTTLPANTTTYSDEGLQPNKLYYYRLKAMSGTETSVYSVPVSGKTLTIPSAPDVPTTPVPADQSRYADTASVQLSWKGSANTITYHLYFGTSETELAPLADITATSYQVTALSENTTYYWRMDASNNLGLTTGDVWSFTTVKTFPSSLVGEWRLDATSGVTIEDSSPFMNHGELLDITDYDWVPGKKNNALDLQHATTPSHILIPHQDHLYFNKNSFSISFWVKAPAQSAQSYIFHKGTFAHNANTGATGKWFGMEIKDGRLRFSVDDDVTKTELSVVHAPFFTNEWTHVVAIRDTQTKKLRLYRNAKLELEINDNTNNGIGQTNPLIIANTGDFNVPFKGMLDEFKAYNYALTQRQVLELFHDSPLPIQPFDPSIPDNSVVEGFDDVTLGWVGGINTTIYRLYFGTDPNALSVVAELPVTENPFHTFSGLAPTTSYYWRVDAVGPEGIAAGNTWTFRTGHTKGLVGHWKLDETTGNVVQDNSNYQHAAMVTGFDPAWQEAGRFGGSLKFETPADTGSINIPHDDHLLFDQNSFTISLWVKIKENTYASGRDCYLIHKGTFEANTGKWYGIQLRDGRLTFAIDDGVTKTDIAVSVTATSPQNIFTDTWKNIIAIRDAEAKQMRVYIDGVLVGQKSYTTGTTGRLVPVKIGNSAERKPYRDLMDDVRLYNYALSLSEIQLLNSGQPLVSKVSNPQPANDTTDVATRDLVLSWSGDAQSYNLYFGSSPETLELKASGLADTTFTLTGDLYNLTKYYWAVDAIRDGEIAMGDTWSFTTAAFSPVDDPESFWPLYSYPNPFTNELNVEFKLLKDDNVKVGLYNLRGKLVHSFVDTRLQKGTYRIQWNVNGGNPDNLDKGIYIIVLQTSKYKLINLLLHKD